MKKIAALTALIILVLSAPGFSQDNSFGDYIVNSFDKNISLDLESARLDDVLKMFSQQTNLNFVSTEAVKDKMLTLYMEDVPLKEAINTIFKANNLAYEYYPESNIFAVKETGRTGVELKTKVYYLKYIRLQSSKIKKEINNQLTAANDDGTGIKAVIENVLSEFGKVIEDPATNSLIVIDIPSQFDAIDSAVNNLDIASPKIMVEVEMLDVSKTHLDKMGFNFANGAYITYTPGARSSYFPFTLFDQSLIKNATSQLTSSVSSGGNTEEGIRGALLGVLDLRSFTAVFQMLVQDTKTKFIARPRILTLSNETAEVKLTSNEVIGVTSTVTENTTTQEIERGETGTKLRVTPQANPHTNEITLFVEMFNRESVDSGIAVSGMTTGNAKNVEERGTKSLVRLKDGETLLIGGLIRKEESETIRKIPFIGDIPFLGKLFTYREKPSADNLERELLVFLTPRVVEEGAPAVKKAEIISREQQDFSKSNSVKVVLDKFGK